MSVIQKNKKRNFIPPFQHTQSEEDQNQGQNPPRIVKHENVNKKEIKKDQKQINQNVAFFNKMMGDNINNVQDKKKSKEEQEKDKANAELKVG